MITLTEEEVNEKEGLIDIFEDLHASVHKK